MRMNPFEMVVLIVAIVMIARIFMTRRAAQAPHIRDDDLESVRLREEVRGLKERVAVLERLATDDNRSIELGREIDRLRGPGPAPD